MMMMTSWCISKLQRGGNINFNIISAMTRRVHFLECNTRCRCTLLLTAITTTAKKTASTLLCTAPLGDTNFNLRSIGPARRARNFSLCSRRPAEGGTWAPAQLQL